MRRYLLTSIVCVVFVLTSTVAWMRSGIYDVSATSGHTRIVAWALHDVYINSLRRHARHIEVPSDLMTLDNIRRGARLYDQTCAQCHGAPDRPLAPVGRGILPQAPALLASTRRNNPQMMYWVIKHGVKMTAMPAFESSYDDASLWQLTAFLAHARGISSLCYEALTQASRQEPTRQAAQVDGHCLPAEDASAPSISVHQDKAVVR